MVDGVRYPIRNKTLTLPENTVFPQSVIIPNGINTVIGHGCRFMGRAVFGGSVKVGDRCEFRDVADFGGRAVLGRYTQLLQPVVFRSGGNVIGFGSHAYESVRLSKGRTTVEARCSLDTLEVRPAASVVVQSSVSIEYLDLCGRGEVQSGCRIYSASIYGSASLKMEFRSEITGEIFIDGQQRCKLSVKNIDCVVGAMSAEDSIYTGIKNFTVRGKPIIDVLSVARVDGSLRRVVFMLTPSRTVIVQAGCFHGSLADFITKARGEGKNEYVDIAKKAGEILKARNPRTKSQKKAISR